MTSQRASLVFRVKDGGRARLRRILALSISIGIHICVQIHAMVS